MGEWRCERTEKKGSKSRAPPYKNQIEKTSIGGTSMGKRKKSEVLRGKEATSEFYRNNLTPGKKSTFAINSKRGTSQRKREKLFPARRPGERT